MKQVTSPLTPERSEADALDAGIRPQSLSDFTGQPQVVENLDVFIRAAKKREEALDHCLLYGPPGLGKTSWAPPPETLAWPAPPPALASSAQSYQYQ